MFGKTTATKDPNKITLTKDPNKLLELILALRDNEQIQKYQLWYDYYNNRQVSSFNDALNAYKNKGVTSNPYEVYAKIGPWEAELLDEVHGPYLYARRNPVTYPITQLVIDSIGSVYNRPPRRTFKTNTEVEKIMETLVANLSLDAIFNQADRMARLFGVTMVLVDEIQKDGAFQNVTVNGHTYATRPTDTRISVITPNYWWPLLHPTTGEVLAVLIEMPNTSKLIDGAFIRRLITPTAEYDFVDEYKYQTIMRKSPVLPCVFLHDQYPVLDFWGRGYGDPLTRLNYQLNAIGAHYTELVMTSTQGVKLFVNYKLTNQLTAAPGWANYVETPTDIGEGKIEDITPNANLSEVKSAQEHILTTGLSTMGLPASLISLNPGNSQPAIIEQKQMLRDNYNQRIKPLIDFENRVWDMIRLQKAETQSELFLEDFDVDVRFKPWPKASNDQDQANARFFMENKMMTPVDVMVEYFDWETEEQAEKQLEKVKKYNLKEAQANEPAGSGDQSGTGGAGNPEGIGTDSGSEGSTTGDQVA